MTPFRPTPKSTLAITTVTGGSPVQLLGLGVGSGSQVRVRNLGTVDAYVEFGDGTVTATVPAPGTPGSIGLAPGKAEIFTLQQYERRVAVAVASGVPAVEVTVGEGVA